MSLKENMIMYLYGNYSLCFYAHVVNSQSNNDEPVNRVDFNA